MIQLEKQIDLHSLDIKEIYKILGSINNKIDILVLGNGSFEKDINNKLIHFTEDLTTLKNQLKINLDQINQLELIKTAGTFLVKNWWKIVAVASPIISVLAEVLMYLKDIGNH